MEVSQLEQIFIDVNNFIIQLDAYLSILMSVIEF
jgi:DNA mismatch repair protein MutS